MKAGAIAWLIYVVITALIVYGYIHNIWLLFHASSPVTGMVVARAIGIFALPMGVILGFM